METLRALALFAALLLAGCNAPSATDAYTRPPDASHTDTLTLDAQQVSGPPAFGGHVPVHVRVTLRVVSGGPIDAWLATAAGCQQYGARSFAPAARILNATNASMDADLPPGDDCLLLDNTDFAMGEAKSAGSVTVNYTISIWERPR